MKQLNLIKNDNDLEFYISVEDKKNSYLVYTSEPFAISEIELLSLIKMCIIRKRNKLIGIKLMEIYKDSTLNRQELTTQRLKAIGIIEKEIPKAVIKKNMKTK